VIAFEMEPGMASHVERHQRVIGEPDKGALPSETRFHLGLENLRLKAAAGRGKKAANFAPPPRPTLPEIRRAVIARLFAPPKLPSRCPHCHKRLRLTSKLPR
jgi:hypothetical protein